MCIYPFKLTTPMTRLQHINEEIPDAVFMILGRQPISDLVDKLGFDRYKYINKTFTYFLLDFANFIRDLNKKYNIYTDPRTIEDLDVTCFFEPWLRDFLQKALEKKNQESKVIS